jgi:hypothetical protein
MYGRAATVAGIEAGQSRRTSAQGGHKRSDNDTVTERYRSEASVSTSATSITIVASDYWRRYISSANHCRPKGDMPAFTRLVTMTVAFATAASVVVPMAVIAPAAADPCSVSTAPSAAPSLPSLPSLVQQRARHPVHLGRPELSDGRLCPPQRLCLQPDLGHLA